MARTLPLPEGSCILFQSNDKSIVVLDIPRSIEQSQTLPGNPATRQILSCEALQEPYKTHSHGPGTLQTQSPASQIEELMIVNLVTRGLQELKQSYSGPWCLPRLTGSSCPDAEPSSNQDDSHSHSSKSTPDCPGQSSCTSPDDSTGYHIPPGSHHLLGSIASQLPAFIATAPTDLDVIVLDPPWPNRSAKRKRKRGPPSPSFLSTSDGGGGGGGGGRYVSGYSTLPTAAAARALLSQIPASKHLRAPSSSSDTDGGLVAVWATNRATVIDTLVGGGGGGGGLFAAWGLDLLGEWVWVKVTARGEPVFDLGDGGGGASPWNRRPWERLLLAARLPRGAGDRGEDGAPAAAAKAELLRRLGFPTGTQRGETPRRLIFAVPDVHSRKPCLKPLFDEVFGSGGGGGGGGAGRGEYKALEIFSRHLTAGWWSWGDDTLRFQRRDCWVEDADVRLNDDRDADRGQPEA